MCVSNYRFNVVQTIPREICATQMKLVKPLSPLKGKLLVFESSLIHFIFLS